MHHHKKKKIRIFYPRGLWTGLAMLALTVGIGLGESHYRDTSGDVLVGHKLARNVQTLSWGSFTGSKQGFSRQNYKVSALDAASANPLEKHEAPPKSGVKSVCFIADPVVETPSYEGELQEIKVSDPLVKGAPFRVEAEIKNTGNMNWYGAEADCAGKTVVNMGTNKTRDRASRFFQEGTNTGWLGTNRVRMAEDLAKPGDTATFVFTGIVPERDAIFREHFSLVAENVTWFDDMNIPIDLRVGQVTEEDEFEAKFLKDISTDTASLDGERYIRIDLSDQQMTLLIGDTEVYHLPISSGASDTPTPVGTFKILNQQELRIGGTAPHYRMPYWQGFTRMGHGLHALPYLGDPGGWFWEEALTHIGIPVSHGCIRMLPDDAALVYEFGELGMRLEVVR